MGVSRHPGRGQDRLVLTIAARTLLSADQMAATLEHERAHLRLHHHRTILAAEVITTGFGPFGLLRRYADQVRRLAELAADDQASHAHGRLIVAAALLEMGSAGPAGRSADGMPALTGPDVGGRIRRLIAAPTRRPSAPVGLLAPAALLVALIAPPPSLSHRPHFSWTAHTGRRPSTQSEMLPSAPVAPHGGQSCAAAPVSRWGRRPRLAC